MMVLMHPIVPLQLNLSSNQKSGYIEQATKRLLLVETVTLFNWGVSQIKIEQFNWQHVKVKGMKFTRSDVDAQWGDCQMLTKGWNGQ